MGGKSKTNLHIDRYRVPPHGRGFRLRDIDPGSKHGAPDRAQVEEETAAAIARIDDLQDVLHAQRKQALLCVLQGMDCSGKDSTIKHVFGPIQPLGLVATNFKQPTQRELAQDYLWRVHAAVPPKGTIGIFNRSHYEDVLIARVHKLADTDVIERRYDQINAFERHLAENGVTIVKFFLHISKAEQKERLQERLDNPKKHWKFAVDDLKERKLWHKYIAAYEMAVTRCSTAWAPWHVIPANHHWYRDALVAGILLRALEGLKLAYPKLAVPKSSVRID